MKYTIKSLTVAITLAAILTLTGCPGPVTPDKPCTHEHKKTDVVKEATCIEDGLEQTICVDCEEVIEEQKLPIDPENHDWVLESDTATCTEDGVKTYNCICCDETKIEVSTAHHHVDYETSGYCENCGEYKFENQFTVNVYTSIDEWYKVHPRPNLRTTMQSSEPIYDECKFSFETNSIPTNLNELIHLKIKYKGYRVHKFYNGAVLTYTEDIENEGVYIMDITDILLSQN